PLCRSRTTNGLKPQTTEGPDRRAAEPSAGRTSAGRTAAGDLERSALVFVVRGLFALVGRAFGRLSLIRCSLGRLSLGLLSLGLLSAGHLARRRGVDELDVGHRRAIAAARAHLDDAGVAAGPILETLA